MSNVVAIVRYSGEIKYWFIATNKLTNVTCSKCLVFSVPHNHQPTPFLIIAQNACNNNYIFVLHSIVNIITRETMRILSEKKTSSLPKARAFCFMHMRCQFSQQFVDANENAMHFNQQTIQSAKKAKYWSQKIEKWDRNEIQTIRMMLSIQLD